MVFRGGSKNYLRKRINVTTQKKNMSRYKRGCLKDNFSYCLLWNSYWRRTKSSRLKELASQRKCEARIFAITGTWDFLEKIEQSPKKNPNL